MHVFALSFVIQDPRTPLYTWYVSHIPKHSLVASTQYRDRKLYALSKSDRDATNANGRELRESKAIISTCLVAFRVHHATTHEFVIVAGDSSAGAALARADSNDGDRGAGQSNEGVDILHDDAQETQFGCDGGVASL